MLRSLLDPKSPSNVAQRIDGKAIAAEVREEVRLGVEEQLVAGKRRPALRVVLVGEDPASASYVRGKRRAAAEVGIDAETLTRPADFPQEELLALLDSLKPRRRSRWNPGSAPAPLPCR